MNRMILASIGAAASVSMLATPALANDAAIQNFDVQSYDTTVRMDEALARIALSDPDAFTQRGISTDPVLVSCDSVRVGMAGDPVIPGCQRSDEQIIRISTVQFGTDGVTTADDFKVLTAGTVDTICAKAIFANFAVTLACTPDTDTARTTGFTVNIYPITMGLPDLTPVGSYDNVTTGNLDVRIEQDIPNGDPTFEFVFEFNLDDDGMGNGPTLQPGCYAVEIVWDQPAGVAADCGWWWLTGETTNGLAFQDGDGSGLVDTPVERFAACEIAEGSDQSLCLTGSAVFGDTSNAGDAIGICIDTSMLAGGQIFNSSCDTRTVVNCGASDSVCISTDDEIAFSAPDVNTCVNAGGDPDTPGFRDIWYSFTPQNANETRVIFDTCGSGVGTDLDNVMAIYTVDPMAMPCEETMIDPDPAVMGDEFVQYANLMLVACGNDECDAGDAEVCIAGLEVNREYFIQIFQNSTLRNGLVTFNVTCSVPEVLNDDCPDSATILDAVANPGTTSAPDPNNPYGFLAPANTIFATSRTGTTQCTGFDPFAIDCGGDTAAGLSPGVWYVMNVNFSDVLRLTTENGPTANFDSQIIVYCGQCEFLTCIGGNDDIEGGGANVQSEFAFCTNAGETYLIHVLGAGETGGFQVQAFRNAGSSGVECPDDASMMRDCSATPDQLDCPPGAILETEVCFDELVGDPDVFNDGCNAGALDPDSGQGDEGVDDALFYQDLACGDVFCGDAQSQIGTRDLDWFEFTITELSIVTLTAEVEFDGQVVLLDSTDCATNVTLALDAGLPGETVSVQEQLAPGTYGVIVSNQAFTGFPCESTLKNYVLSIECEPLGSCCTDMGADCIVTTEADCMDRGGSFIAGGTCGDISYVNTPDIGDYCAIAFSDISGNPGVEQFFFDVAATEGQNENNDAEFFAIDDPNTAATPEQEIFFPIEFYAQEFDSFFVISEGFFAIEGSTTIDTDPSDNPLGTPDDSVNRIIAPFWTSQNPIFGGATFWFETAGTAPFRTLTIQYTNIQRFNSADGEFGDNSYQVIFDESNPCIVFTYGLMSPGVSAADAPGIQVGVESFDPSEFTSIDLDLIGAGGTQVDAGGPGMDAPTCFRLCPTDLGTEDPCEDDMMPPNFCPGDVNGDGITSTADITFVVSNLGASGMSAPVTAPPAVSGDANRDGATQTADITFVVSNLGCSGGDTFSP